VTIARVWFTRVREDDADAFEAYLRQTGGQDIPATPGSVGHLLVRRAEGDVVRFGVISLWESEDAIRAFAGDDVTLVRYYPRDHEWLLEMPSRAEHFVVLEDARAETPNRSG